MGFFRYHLDLPRLSLRGVNRIVLFNKLTLLDSFGRPFAGIILLFLFNKIYGIVIGYILIELIVRWVAYKAIPIDTKGDFTKSHLQQLIKFGGATSIARIASLLVFYSSSFIIGWRLGVPSIAIFQSTIALPFLIFRFAIIPFTNLLPELVQQFQTGGSGVLRDRGLPLHLKIMTAGSFIYLIVVVVNGPFVTFWVGPELYAGCLFTMIYSSFCFLSIARHNGYMAYQANGVLRPIVIAHIIELPLNIFLSIILIGNIGLIGVPTAFVLAHFPVFLVSQGPFFKKYLLRLNATCNS